MIEAQFRLTPRRGALALTSLAREPVADRLRLQDYAAPTVQLVPAHCVEALCVPAVAAKVTAKAPEVPKPSMAKDAAKDGEHST